MCSICKCNPCKGACPNSETLIIGCCAQCHGEIDAGYEYYQDAEDNLFCELDCALDYYGIESV